MAEIKAASAAFQTYVELGSRRSLRKLAEKLNIPYATVKKWSREHIWRDSIKLVTHAVQAAPLNEVVPDVAQLPRTRLEKARYMIEMGRTVLERVDPAHLSTKDALILSRLKKRRTTNSTPI